MVYTRYVLQGREFNTARSWNLLHKCSFQLWPRAWNYMRLDKVLWLKVQPYRVTFTWLIIKTLLICEFVCACNLVHTYTHLSWWFRALVFFLRCFYPSVCYSGQSMCSLSASRPHRKLSLRQFFCLFSTLTRRILPVTLWRFFCV